MKILSSQRIEPGTAIRIGIAEGIDGPFTLLSSRVVYVKEAISSKWFVGCVFTPRLREGILKWIEQISAIANGSKEAEGVHGVTASGS